MVNLIEDERALLSCSTTITSSSVSSRAGNDVFYDLLLSGKNRACVLGRDGLTACHSAFHSAKAKDSLHVGIRGVAKDDVYL